MIEIVKMILMFRRKIETIENKMIKVMRGRQKLKEKEMNMNKWETI